MIQALLRWKTDTSLKEYGRLTYSMYAGFLRGAAQVTELQVVAGANIPRPQMDPPDHLADVLDAIHIQAPRGAV